MRSHQVLESAKVHARFLEARQTAELHGSASLPTELRKYGARYLVFKEAARDFEFAKAESDLLEWKVSSTSPLQCTNIVHCSAVLFIAVLYSAAGKGPRESSRVIWGGGVGGWGREC